MTADPKDVRECLAAYDAWASTYDDIDNPLIAQAAVALDARADWLAGARVLELGCGTGRNACACLAHGARQYTGVDGSPGMLAEARRRVADPRATWIEGDLAGAAAGSSFDVVVICLVLEHVLDVAPSIAAAARALVAGGRLLVLELHPALHAKGVGANFRAGDREVRLPSFRHDASELEAACARVGLRVAHRVDHRPSAEALRRSPKLGRYASDLVLLEIAASAPT